MKNFIGWVLVMMVLITPQIFADDGLESLQADADSRFQSGDWDAAAQSYEKLTQAEPTQSAHWQRLGAARLNLKQYDSAISAYKQALHHLSDPSQASQLYFSIARAHAAADDKAGLQSALAQIAKAGGTPYLSVMNATEFKPFLEDVEVLSSINQLRPCQTDNHRAFDFWLGEWQVTSPARPGWQASSSIKKGNDGCTIHESYSTPGGYAGTSVNFYDSSKGQWHQTWIDNQGQPLQLEGGFNDGNMVLGDGQNRITWTPLTDGRVRQHWEVTNDNGASFQTVFDGVYVAVNPR